MINPFINLFLLKETKIKLFFNLKENNKILIGKESETTKGNFDSTNSFSNNNTNEESYLVKVLENILEFFKLCQKDFKYFHSLNTNYNKNLSESSLSYLKYNER